MDGEWEPPMIDNPEYKGEWEAKQIDNPKYSGVWVHPMIPNPDYEPDDQLYAYDDFGLIGLDLWQVNLNNTNMVRCLVDWFSALSTAVLPTGMPRHPRMPFTILRGAAS